MASNENFKMVNLAYWYVVALKMNSSYFMFSFEPIV
jgi:hypothetical protein